MGANAQTSVPAFTSGQVLTAAQMTQVNTGIPVFADSTDRDAAFGGAGEKTLAEGQMAYLEDTNATQYYDGSSWSAIAGGKILQVVRGTDTTNRTTTSSSLVDANISVTITPTSASSNILLWWSVHIDSQPGTQATSSLVITDSSDNIIDGTGNVSHGLVAATRNLLRSNFIAWDSPATTSATTYKGRFQANAGSTCVLSNASSTGQLFALEISA